VFKTVVFSQRFLLAAIYQLRQTFKSIFGEWIAVYGIKLREVLIKYSSLISRSPCWRDPLVENYQSLNLQLPSATFEQTNAQIMGQYLENFKRIVNASKFPIIKLNMCWLIPHRVVLKQYLFKVNKKVKTWTTQVKRNMPRQRKRGARLCCERGEDN
jgi:hypothetical protein